ncbi:hypothetical protein RND71_010686 [Anisodus tanguticus]|uniref:Uncharacterized protein n=1 Tax=Anisodus tanguticus TaxID=243964 RepID=A0AAE1SM42_9SOLA|nr:hypothetical protein RND71_010686 [Anisodus tanguticus]
MDDQIVLDKGGKRQLPRWTFATSAADQVKEKVKTDKVDNNNNNTEEEIVTKRRKNRRIKDKKEAFTEESTTELSICQTTKRSRRKLDLPLPNDDCNDESGLTGSKCDGMKIEGGVEMEESTTKAIDRSSLRKRRCSRMKGNSNDAGPSLRRQKQKAKNSRNGNCADVEESTPKSDDEDLTIEDLMNIAEEYAGDDDEDLTVEDLMSIAKEDAISMSIGSLSCIEVDNQSLRRETNSDCISVQERTIEDAPPKVNMSENPTQDMLDLFLGPLLKKTHEEKRVELVREEMSLARDLNKKNQSDPSGDRPAVVKKKSSLKDKVLLLLD